MLTRLAHAKLNLALRVDPPEADGARKGWHRIGSWMHAIGLADDLEFAQARATSFEISWADDAPRQESVDWALEEDLAFRAHEAIERHVGRELPAGIRIRKRIPTGSGLGGGSSDAACTLVAINELYALGIEIQTLREIGLRLGSDVPFFLDDMSPPLPAVVSGFGETIERSARRSEVVTLFISSVHCSTPCVYGEFDASGVSSAADDRVIASLAHAGGIDEAKLFNDLAGPALRLSPDLQNLHDALGLALGGRVHVTGSGSALFTFSRELDSARAIADEHGATVVSTRLI